MNDFLATTPFDLYELHLFQRVVRHGSFTRAAVEAGLTQSAVTRQLQGMERSLGLALLERTTRRVRPTPAGEFLYAESLRVLGDVDQALQRLREDFAGARKEIRVGVSRSIGLAHLPGFFHANQRRAPDVSTRVSHRSGSEILLALEAGELDLGILGPPPRLPKTLRITHRFDDAFTLIAPAGGSGAPTSWPDRKAARDQWLARQNWLLLEESSQTGRRLRNWMTKQGWKIQPTMQLDSFDLIINLVSLGYGVSLVPIRTLALYGQKRTWRRLELPQRFVRELVVVVRKRRVTQDHLQRFVDNILF